MTVVNTATGEIVETLDKVAARRLTDRIRLLAETVAEQVDKMAALIDEARVGSAWLALGHSSWTAYVADEFGGIMPRLDREPRQEFVRELADRGMSVRSIAPIVGVSKSQVSADLEVSSSGHLTKTPQVEQSSGPHEVTVPSTGDVALPARPAVTGIDGKTYSRPEPKQSAPRPALTDSAADYDNAEKASKSLSNAIAKLLEFQHPNMREAMRRYWAMASNEVPPTPRRDVTPEQMRAAAQGLLALADEWSTK